MREIKFRVWEPLNKDMRVLDFCLYQFDGSRNSHKFVLPPERQSMQKPYTFMNLEAVEVMQYTGLTDKNDIEIYEGDVVAAGIGGIENFEIRFVKGRFTMKAIESDEKSLWILDEKCEVIGNVYENPELLEDSK